MGRFVEGEDLDLNAFVQVALELSLILLFMSHALESNMPL